MALRLYQFYDVWNLKWCQTEESQNKKSHAQLKLNEENQLAGLPSLELTEIIMNLLKIRAIFYKKLLGVKLFRKN